MDHTLQLQVEINKNSGFCFGVVAAIQKAEESLSGNDEVYCLGQLVHNDAEMERLEKQGLITIDYEKLTKLKNKNILFRAHGEPPSTYAMAEQNKHTIIDTTCPIILKIHNRINKAYHEGANILIFGKHNHPETKGLLGYTNNTAIVFEKVEELDVRELPNDLVLFSQTTMSLKEFRQAIDILRNAGKNLTVNDTICRQVTKRKPELRDFCAKMDVVLMVAGKNSSNGKLLFTICKSSNQRAYYISAISEINIQWFNRGEKVGITGATSTPLWQMEKVKDFLQSM